MQHLYGSCSHDVSTLLHTSPSAPFELFDVQRPNQAAPKPHGCVGGANNECWFERSRRSTGVDSIDKDLAQIFNNFA